MKSAAEKKERLSGNHFKKVIPSIADSVLLRCHINSLSWFADATPLLADKTTRIVGLPLRVAGMIGYFADAADRLVEISRDSAEINGYHAEASSYPVEMNGYRAEASGYHVEMNGYRAEASGYHVEMDGYRAETSGYHAEMNGYHAETSGYHAEMNDYSAETSGYHSEITFHLQTTRFCLRNTGSRNDRNDLFFYVAFFSVSPHGTGDCRKLLFRLGCKKTI